MKITQLYPDKWLSAKHLQGRTVTVTVESAAVEHLFNPRTKRNEPKFVLGFYKKSLRLVLNKTQAQALVAITGQDDSDDWKGHQISLSPSIAPNGAATITISKPEEKPAPVQQPASVPTFEEVDADDDLAE